MSKKRTQYTRRDMLKYGGAAGAATIIGKRALAATTCAYSPIPIEDIAFTTCGVDGEPMATSPFILQPYTQALPIPTAMRPGFRQADGTLTPDATNAWTVRKSVQFGDNTIVRPGPAPGQQDALGDRPATANQFQSVMPHAGTHQLFPGGLGTSYQYLAGQAKQAFDLLSQNILLYHIRLQVSGHSFTNSPVASIDSAGNITAPPGVASSGVATLPFGFAAAGAQVPTYLTPESTIYGFNGSFPGPRINYDYGKPVNVRFENDLDLNPGCRDRQDFGAPDWAFLTHLHNGHTAPESDGQPHHMSDHGGGYQPTEWCDNLYLGYPAGGDDNEKQSFLWFHDHRMHHTGPNVYKGMVGIMPHYDPTQALNPSAPGLDSGDERFGLHLPGRRRENGDGTFDVDYDIPLVFYDCRLDDGITPHEDEHTPTFSGQFPQLPPNQFCGNTHPEWWGMLYHRHYPNHGFVGDIMTVNGAAYPTLTVFKRRYRFRYLDASVSRQYRLSFRQGQVFPFPGTQGQWLIGNVKGGKLATTKGILAMDQTLIAAEGGLLPFAIPGLPEVEVWPAKRREVVVDFGKYKDGTPTKTGDVVYLCNTLQMLDGRKETGGGDPGFDSSYSVALVKIVIDGDPPEPDQSVVLTKTTPLRTQPFVNFNAVKARDFTLQRGGSAGGETEWLINGLQFDPFAALAGPTINTFEAWGINNGGGGWTHPMHIHMEEHHVIFRSTAANFAPNVADTGREDVVALQGSEQTTIYRGFRTFLGNYVAHCHNLAHEDHNMMFGWSITPP